MDQGKLNSHYKRLAGSYNQAFTSSTDKDKKGYVFLGEEGARTLMELLRLKKQDKLVDLGAGTCVNALQLAQLAELEQAVLSRIIRPNNSFLYSYSFNVQELNIFGIQYLMQIQFWNIRYLVKYYYL